MRVNRDELITDGAPESVASAITAALEALPADASSVDAWNVVRSLVTPRLPHSVHRRLFDAVYRTWPADKGPPPAWTPRAEDIESSNIAAFCRGAGVAAPASLYRWSIEHRAAFWDAVVRELDIAFHTRPREILDLSSGVETPRWLAGARMNIAESCFRASPEAVAVVYQPESGPIQRMAYGELEALCNRFANSLGAAGFGSGDAVAIAMPMTVEAVAAYIGIVKAGCVVVSIADSFSAAEIGTRLRIGNAKAVVTQDVVIRGAKQLPMFERVVGAGAQSAIVVPATGTLKVALRGNDFLWSDFLSTKETFTALPCDPDDTTNILFSSGTTGDPKAIPWTHTTPIKCAMDGYLHQDIHAGDVVAWPTNLGWMMGPWLIYASLVNRAAMALHYGAPGTHEFRRFVQEAGVTMLGLVPSIVKAWRNAGDVEDFDWSVIKVFSSTGEISNPDDYLYLMSRVAGYRPVIEYCGGTEIGGGYISGTVVQPASPSTFSTPAYGLDFVILDENGHTTRNGELFLVPPSIGLSTRLINRDHHEVYYDGTPRGPRGALLRRHGDTVEELGAGYFRETGRADDTMNLSGIKVGTAEIERVATVVEGVLEIAAIAAAPRDGGPSQLVLYVVPEKGASLERETLRKALQRAIAGELNPLFRVHDVVIIDALPRTASNKVMRRVLRTRYQDAQ